MAMAQRLGFNLDTGEWEAQPAAADRDIILKRLQRIVEQVESHGGYLAGIFGINSPEYQANRNLWIILRHDLAVMEQQAAAG
jgi:hypothetical protein